MWDIVSDGVKGCQICFPRTIPHTPSLKTGSGVYMFCVFVDKRIPTTVKCRSKFRQLIDSQAVLCQTYAPKLGEMFPCGLFPPKAIVMLAFVESSDAAEGNLPPRFLTLKIPDTFGFLFQRRKVPTCPDSLGSSLTGLGRPLPAVSS